MFNKSVAMSLVFAQVALLPLSLFAQAKYEGSSFNQVLSVIHDSEIKFTSKDQKEEFKVYQNGQLPHYGFSTIGLMFGSPSLASDAQRTIHQRQDVYPYLQKKLHPNGVCVAGVWNVTEETKYSGLFKKNSKALLIGRISTTMDAVEYDERRGFGFTGKLFPTMDPNKVVPTAHFFTVDNLTGYYDSRLLETSLTNEPGVGFDLTVIGAGLFIINALSTADKNPGFRPLHELAQAGEKGAIVVPKYIRISASEKMRRNNQSDFRNEVLQAVTDNKNLIFEVSVNDKSSDTKHDGWQKIGTINVNQAKVSYSCDRRVHFAHPKMP